MTNLNKKLEGYSEYEIILDDDYDLSELKMLQDLENMPSITNYIDPYNWQKTKKRNICDRVIKNNRLSPEQKKYLIWVYTNICLVYTSNKIQFKLPSEKLRQDISDELNKIGGSRKIIKPSIVKSWFKNWRNRDGRLSHWKKLKGKNN